MKNNKIKNLNSKNRGLSILGIFFLGIIIIFTLSYFRINIREIAESPTGQDNINYIEGSSKSFWDKYLKDPASYLWNDIWVDIFWKSFISNMERIRDGQPTDLENAAPKANPNQ